MSNNNKKYYIYSLRHPNRKRIRYVGKTNNPVQRLNDHIKGLRNSEKDKWIRSILSKGMKPVLDILEECKQADWHKREAFYIKKFKRGGNKLFNSNRAIKNRTDEDLKKRIQNAVLTGEYIQTKRRNDHLIRVVVKTSEFGYLMAMLFMIIYFHFIKRKIITLSILTKKNTRPKTLCYLQ